MGDFLKVVQLQDARDKLEEYWTPEIKNMTIPIEDAFNRILLKDVKSEIDLPPFNRSTVDGYAIKASDSFGAEEDDPVKLVRVGEIHAGDDSIIQVRKSECIEISTGAVMPNGANAVVMIENISEVSEYIKIRSPVSPGENVSEKGSEIKKGETIAFAKQKISPQIHGALHAAGIQMVNVIRKPKVAVISSGKEIIKSGEKLRPGEIYDVNGPTISDSVKACGGKNTQMGIIPDNTSEIREILRRAVLKHDLIITSGGSSAGKRDILPEAIDELGKPGVLIHGIAQKPGKPTLIAVVNDKPIFGLPGYPVSALMIYDQLVSPYIRKLSGVPEPRLRSVQAKLKRKIISARGRRELVPVRLIREDKDLLVSPLPRYSGAITSLSKASGYIDVPLSREILERDELVTIKLFEGNELA